MENNDKSTVLTFEREPIEMDFDKEIKWFLESSPYGSNRESALQYMGILISAKPPVQHHGPVIVQSTDVGKTL